MTPTHYPSQAELPDSKLTDMALALRPELFGIGEDSEWTIQSENLAKTEVLENYEALTELVSDGIRQAISTEIERYVDELQIMVTDAIQKTERYKTAGDITDLLEEIQSGLGGLHEDVLDY